jgi:predicted transcriptional regulator
MMETIELRPDLQRALQEDAMRESRSINDIVTDAVERYLYEQSKTKILWEIEAYHRMHSELKQKYLHQWVAVHDQKLIDHDEDRTTLHRRVHEKYGDISILIREVMEQPEVELRFRTRGRGKIES